MTVYEISFNVTDASNATIYYGLSTGNYPNNTTNTSQLMFHNISLTGLSPNTTYYFQINVTNNTGYSNISSELNFTTISDLINPTWSDNTTYPMCPVAYSPTQVYQFNISWDDYNFSNVWIEHNFTSSFVNYSTTANSSGVYYYNYTGLRVGNYSWRMYANDTFSNSNYTTLYNYTVIRANSSFNLTLNGTAGNMSPVQPQGFVFINATLLLGEANLTMYVNGTLTNTSKNITYLVQFNDTGTINVTVIYNQTQNYSSSTKVYYITVNDTLPPHISFNNPTNNSFVNSTSFILNFTTNELATCNFTLNNSYYNNSLVINQTSHNITLNLNESNYNLTVNCTDNVNRTRMSTLNFTVDTTSPVLDISEPISNQVISNFSIELNYSINESYFDSLWYTLNYNTTKYSVTHSMINGSFNISIISFTKPGKQVLVLFGNDSAGNIQSTNVSFYINKTYNITTWLHDLNHSMSNTTSIELFNSSFNNLSNNITMYQNLSLELNFTNITLNVYNFSATNALWDFLFTAEDNSSSFVSLINANVGTHPIDYVYVRNFSLFYNNTNRYYAKVKLPRNSSHYQEIYYCSEDDLSDCAVVSNCTTTAYAINTSTACYNNTANNVYVFVPHLSAVFGANDTTAPTVTVTAPINGSILNYSYSLSLNFTTSESSTCKYLLSKGTYNNLSTASAFITTFNSYNNSYQNISINCTDRYNQSSLSRIYFTVNDTTPPTISDLDSDSTSENITITLTTSEPSNKSSLLIGNVSVSNGTYVTSHFINFSGLTSDRTYDFNITFCDKLGNCNSTKSNETTDPVTTTTTTSTSGGSGSSAGASTKVNQIFAGLDKGQHTMNIVSSAIAFTRMIFTVNKQINTSVLMSVENKDILSDMKELENIVYQYLKVEKSVLKEDDITTVVFKFRVDNTWLNNNNVDPGTITLYRYTTKWDKLSTKRLSEDSSFVYYEATSPGLSYFGISGVENPVVETSGNETSQNDTTPTGDVVKDDSPEEETPAILSDTKKKKISFVIPFIVITLIIVLVAGFALYQTSISAVSSDNELNELRQYVLKCKTQGIASNSIKEVLLKNKWEETIIDMVLNQVKVPDEEIQKLSDYITKAKEQGETEQAIHDNLKKVGWQDEVINEAFKKKTT